VPVVAETPSGEVGDSANGDGEAQRTGLLLLPPSPLLSASRSRDTSSGHAIPASKLLYELLALLALVEEARDCSLQHLQPGTGGTLQKFGIGE
jgi:hypothetical protein